MTVISQLQNNKKDLNQVRVVTQPMPELKPGEALLRISRLALTTNNITYAAFGETPHLRYWDFFPTGAAEWFHMPAWGFAEVVWDKPLCAGGRWLQRSSRSEWTR